MALTASMVVMWLASNTVVQRCPAWVVRKIWWDEQAQPTRALAIVIVFACAIGDAETVALSERG